MATSDLQSKYDVGCLVWNNPASFRRKLVPFKRDCLVKRPGDVLRARIDALSASVPRGLEVSEYIRPVGS